MSFPKRHHYLPEFYLRGFCRDTRFWVFDREETEFRLQTPTNTTVQTHYYSIRSEDGELDPSIEKTLSEIEGSSSPIIEKLDRGERITIDEKATLSVFAGIQSIRVPDAKKRHEEIRRGILDKLGDDVVPATEEEIGQASSVVPPEEAGPRVSAYDLVQNLKMLEQDSDLAHNDFLKMIFPLGIRISEVLYQMSWLVVHCQTHAGFITTDNPFITLPPEGYDPRGLEGFGIASRGAVKVMPLSARSCLLILDPGIDFTHKSVPNEVVEEINLRLAVMCDRFLVSPHEQQARSVVRKSGIDKGSRGPRVIIE